MGFFFVLIVIISFILLNLKIWEEWSIFVYLNLESFVKLILMDHIAVVNTNANKQKDCWNSETFLFTFFHFSKDVLPDRNSQNSDLFSGNAYHVVLCTWQCNTIVQVWSFHQGLPRFLTTGVAWKHKFEYARVISNNIYIIKSIYGNTQNIGPRTNQMIFTVQFP